MKVFCKCISVFLVVLFVAYGGGVCFSLHNCEHCHKVKMYVFQHPDCCPASEIEHHHQKSAENNHTHCCGEENCTNELPKSSPNANTAHCKQCCVSDFVCFKIKSDYTPSRYEKLPSDNHTTNILSFNSLREEWILPLSEVTDNKHLPKEIPPLLPGGERFIIFSHQLLFYA